MNPYASLLGGLLLMALGAFGIYVFRQQFLMVLEGVVGVAVLLVGVIFLMIGVSDVRDRLREKKEAAAADTGSE
ncbi:hypothetical protein [Candidatus Alkanophaga liquidiphilum]|nr:hypothetical protein [Candidatus Alkanophaga liquidiphilum]RLG38922.1 MAG: hypothetical protein DRN91_01275 [Candidatus Alkanophagales archaeon]